MENSEQQEQIINLGKLFVKELGLEPGVDTLSKWMAHYIAEKMALAEQLASDVDIEKAQKECFETILKLWEHRWSLPSGKRPLEEFESILKTLKQLNPENQDPFFHRQLEHKVCGLEKEDLFLKEIADYTNMALQIDKTARIWIEFVLNQAAMKSKNEKTETVLKNAYSLHQNDDVLAVRMILDGPYSLRVFDAEENVEKNDQLKKLKRRIEDLEKFTKLNEYLLSNYKKELEKLI